MSGSSINEDAWQKLYSFYCQTYFDRGQRPYLNLKFFKMIADKKEIKPVIFFLRSTKMILLGLHYALREAIPCMEDIGAQIFC